VDTALTGMIQPQKATDKNHSEQRFSLPEIPLPDSAETNVDVLPGALA